MKTITAQFKIYQDYKTYTVSYIEATNEWKVYDGNSFIYSHEETRQHKIKTDERAKQILRIALIDNFNDYNYGKSIKRNVKHSEELSEL